MTIQSDIAHIIHAQLDDTLSVHTVEQLLEVPKQETFGDIAFPTFQLAKHFRKNPNQIALELADTLSDPLIQRVEVVGPYINIFLNRQQISASVIQTILTSGDDYGSQSIGDGQHVPIDMSSPNIAKPMSMGHLRSTVIGNALSHIIEKMGFTPVRINHIGDWGTQFGKLIYAYRQWGDEVAIEEQPIAELLRLYVKFHDEAEKDDRLNDEGRRWFNQLENGDPEAQHLWEKFRDVSLKEFNRIYDRLNVTFDSTNGEAFYNDKMDPIIAKLEAQDLMTIDDGAYIVDLSSYDLNPALIKKKDGSTLYITRDLAAAFYRQELYNFAQSLYVVGLEQSNHFVQLKAVLRELGCEWEQDMHHIGFGLITKDGKKLSTRKGKIVLLEEVLDEAVQKSLLQIQHKNPDLHDKETVAEQVGVGAVIFHDLKNDRTNNFDFTIDEVVQFEGETGPYVQYTRVRALSILDKANYSRSQKHDFDGLTDDYSWYVVKLLEDFPRTLERAYHQYEPSVLAKYVIQLAQAFNKFYSNVRVLDDDPAKQTRLALVDAVQEVIRINLHLLGLQSPEEM